MKSEDTALEPQPVNPSRQSSDALFSLRSKMAFSFGALFAVIVLAVSLIRTFGIPFTSDQGSYGQQRSDVLTFLSLVADLKKDRLMLWLEERMGDVESLSQSEVVAAFLKNIRESFLGESVTSVTQERLREGLVEDEGYKAVKRRLRGITTTFRFYEKILIADVRHGVVLSSTDEMDVGSDVSRMPCFARALNAPDRTCAGIMRSAKTGRPSLNFSRVLSVTSADGQKRMLGVLVMRIDAEEFVKPLSYATDKLGKTGDVILADDDLRLLISLKFPLADGTTAKPLDDRVTAEPAKLAAAGHEGIVSSRDYRDEPVLAAYRHITVTPDLGWGMVVKVDEAEVFESTRQRLIQSWLVSLLGVLAAAVIASLIAGRISRPILNLSRVAEEVRAGNLDVRSTVSGADEVGNLAITFNSMIDRFRNWHEELQEEVKARTAQLTRLNAELEAKNAELERFTYTVSHDLSSPLITIKTFTGFVEQDLKKGDTGQVQADLERITRAADRMGQLLEELLELSRIGRMVNPSSIVPLSELAHEALELLAGPVSERAVEVKIAADMPMVYGDRSRLLEVLQNLLENALKFMGDQPNPKVQIGVRHDNGEDVVYVRDNGIGIDPAYQDRIFRLFDKLDQKAEGTGIGLTLVKRIVEVHGGRIWVESDGPGHGSTFCFTLPRHAPVHGSEGEG